MVVKIDSLQKIIQLLLKIHQKFVCLFRRFFYPLLGTLTDPPSAKYVYFLRVAIEFFQTHFCL